MKLNYYTSPVFVILCLALLLSSCKEQEVLVDPPKPTPIGDLYAKSNSYQVKKEEMTKIVSLTSSSITFSSSPGYKAGDIIFSDGFDSKTPKGFLRKVTSVSGNTLNTGSVSLTEAFEAGELTFSSDASSLKKKATGETVQGTHPLTYLIYDGDGNSSTTNDQLKLEGFLGIDGDITGSIKFPPLKISANFNFTAELDLNLVATGAISYSSSNTLFVAEGLPIVVSGVVLTPELRVTFVPQVSVIAQAKSGINDKITLRSSVSYDAEWKINNNFGNVFTAKPVEVQLNGNLKGTLMFEFSVYIYESIGPGFGIGPYVEFNIDVNQNPWWRLYAGAEGNLLVKTKGIASIIPDYSYNLFDSKRLIAQATSSDNPPIVATLAATTISSTGATLNSTVDPSGLSTSASFEYGTDSTLSNYASTISQSAGSGTSAINFSQPVSGLSSSTPYYFRIAANNSAGASRGTILPFATLPTPNQETWIQKSDFGGTARAQAVGFSASGKGYVGTGLSGGGATKDFWEFDPASNTWTQKADFSGNDRSSAVGFSIGNKGYIGTARGYSKDFWEYDPSSNKWTKKADFGGTGRYRAVGFSIGNKGYIGMGADTANNYSRRTRDFWEYDPASNSWTQKKDFPGTGREAAVGFSIGDKGYVGLGSQYENGRSSVLRDFWEYGPATNEWTRRADFGGSARFQTVNFAINGEGYVGLGFSGSGATNDFWAYDPVSNTWAKKLEFGGTARGGAVGFSIGNKGYIGTGGIGGSTQTEFRDFWEYTPQH